jgi:rhamnogalacturonan endolyase
VGFQIHDIDGDGNNEVIYCMNQEIIAADGATGKVKYSKATPLKPPGDHGEHNIFPRILGDSLFFCDLRGLGQDRDIIFKDRYRHIWAMNDKFEVIWTGKCNTGHYPFAYDIDNDGKDEVAIGYSMFDHDGTKLWSLDDKIKDHADGVAIARFNKGAEPIIFYAASDAGAFYTDLKGNVLRRHFLGHVQNPAVANLRDDLPGLEIVSINFWGNQGIIHYFDSGGDMYYDFEPVQHGSMCLPINWTGKSEEFFVLSPDVTEGGMYDGWGRRAVQFPADGHPYQCNAVLDVTGDCRDEVVVWDPYELWVYTQDDNPKQGRLYKPQRNGLYNYSNYQATVSLPGWSR